MIEISVLKALSDNFIYILKDESGQIAAIDPSEARPVINFLEEKKLNLNFIFNTHHHWDHIGGNEELKARYQAKIFCSSYDLKRIPSADEALLEGQDYRLGKTEYKIIEIPGHTLGHIAIHFPNQKIIFTGDTLFGMGCGRLFEGSPQVMFQSLSKIKTLDPNSIFYCGHEYTLKNISFAKSLGQNPEALTSYEATIKKQINETGSSMPCKLREELQLNPFLTAKSVEEFAELRKQKDNF